MPRPPADSRLDLMYARSSKARRSTLMIRSIAGLMVSETIKTHSTVAWVILPNGTVSGGAGREGAEDHASRLCQNRMGPGEETLARSDSCGSGGNQTLVPQTL